MNPCIILYQEQFCNGEGKINVKLVISSGSIVTEESKESPSEHDLQKGYGVASTERAKDRMEKTGILEVHRNR
jgi:hypothetical protein